MNEGVKRRSIKKPKKRINARNRERIPMFGGVGYFQ